MASGESVSRKPNAGSGAFAPDKRGHYEQEQNVIYQRIGDGRTPRQGVRPYRGLGARRGARRRPHEPHCLRGVLHHGARARHGRVYHRKLYRHTQNRARNRQRNRLYRRRVRLRLQDVRGTHHHRRAVGGHCHGRKQGARGERRRNGRRAKRGRGRPGHDVRLCLPRNRRTYAAADYARPQADEKARRAS